MTTRGTARKRPAVKRNKAETAETKPAKKKAAAKTAKKTAKKKTGSKKAAPKKKAAKKTPTKKKWSRRVNETSDAMDLRKGIFEQKDSRKIAASLKRSAEKSKRRKAGPFQSAMSMLNFYVNRGGRNLSASRIKVLDKAKDELRKLFGREPEE